MILDFFSQTTENSALDNLNGTDTDGDQTDELEDEVNEVIEEANADLEQSLEQSGFNQLLSTSGRISKKLDEPLSLLDQIESLNLERGNSEPEVVVEGGRRSSNAFHFRKKQQRMAPVGINVDTLSNTNTSES